MEKRVPVLLVFLAFHFLKAASQDFIDWWNIDCGSELPRVNNHSMPLPYYIVRAGFYHGNYDGLSRPPTFDLTSNGKNWTTVNTTSSMGGMVPFPLTSDNDPNGAAFHLVTRTNFGGPEVRFAMDGYNDSYNRIWASGSTPKGCENVSTMPDLIEPLQNAPPTAVLVDSIASINASDPILLIVDLPPLDGPHPAYFIFYFSNPAPQSQLSGIIGTRATQIYINGQLKSNITFEWGKSRVVTIDPVDVMGPTINITLAPDPDSNLPTMISGLEVFTRHYEKYEAPAFPPPSAATPLLLIFVYIILSHCGPRISMARMRDEETHGPRVAILKVDIQSMHKWKEMENDNHRDGDRVGVGSVLVPSSQLQS
ncbi:hypothetical protein CK203_092670 [Vitis vinifera]|uniref:Malectin-like domain-containing protein n=1 Tax=Vitis vinifera TaxID=29760 RepID=A0A438ENN8_VITVI|nr:hypothetical protein CK203_092670 [Vitis vinifera]